MTEDPTPAFTYGYRSGDFVFRSAEGEHGILEGRLLPYDQWARIDSIVEGKFYERFRPRSITKTLNEKASSLRVLFEHGFSPLVGSAPIAKFESFRDEDDGVHYTAPLLRGIPELVMDGLRNGQYGSSIRHKPIKAEVNRRPGKSDYNPEGWEERSVTEALLKEFSVVAFPAYAGATASVRSLTDDFYRSRLEENPERLLELMRGNVEPSHSEPAPQEDPDGETGSRATQTEETTPPVPKRDWLAPTEEKEGWHIP